MMNPEKRFRLWMSTCLATAVGAFAYFLIADIHMPISADARLIYRVTQVSPEVNGRVVRVAVANNQRVQRGDLLFEIDPLVYRNAVQNAELQLEQAVQSNAELDAAIASAASQVNRAQAQYQDAEREHGRFRLLSKEGFVSRAALDKAEAQSVTASAELEAARAALQAAKVRRGSAGEQSLRLRLAHNALANSRIDLTRSKVTALEPGVVSNLQLEAGTYAQAGVPRLALVSTSPQLHADFREKSLRGVAAGTLAEVAFDALPGLVFKSEVTSLEPGIADGHIVADGRLASPDHSDRWLRDAERVRVNLRLLQSPPVQLMSGARATVQLHTGTGGVRLWLGHAQIQFVSYLHYVY